MRRLAVVAAEPEAGLAGYGGPLPGGEARRFDPVAGDELAAWRPDAVLVLGDAAGPPFDGPVVRWSERRALLPAGDHLFELEAGDPARVLVAGASDGRRAALLADLEQRAVPATAADSLDAAGLAAAGVVILLGDVGAQFPAAAPAVLAAGRLLVAPRTQPNAGLLPGIDHLAYDNDSQAAQCADAALAAPDAFAAIRVLGGLAATRHRASTLYARLLTDLELEGALA